MVPLDRFSMLADDTEMHGKKMMCISSAQMTDNDSVLVESSKLNWIQ